MDDILKYIEQSPDPNETNLKCGELAKVGPTKNKKKKKKEMGSTFEMSGGQVSFATGQNDTVVTAGGVLSELCSQRD